MATRKRSTGTSKKASRKTSTKAAKKPAAKKAASKAKPKHVPNRSGRRRKRVAPVASPEDAEAVKASLAEQPSSTGEGTAEERARRNYEIFRGWCRGLDVPTLGATYGLTSEAVNLILRDERKQVRTLRHNDPTEIVDQQLLQLEAMISSLAMEVSRGKTTGERVRALAEQRNTIGEVRQLMQDIGVLPQDLGRMRAYLDAARLAEGLANLITKYDLPDEMMAELKALLPMDRVAAHDIEGNGKPHELEPAA